MYAVETVDTKNAYVDPQKSSQDGYYSATMANLFRKTPPSLDILLFYIRIWHMFIIDYYDSKKQNKLSLR